MFLHLLLCCLLQQVWTVVAQSAECVFVLQKLVRARDSPQCAICEFVMKEVEDMLSDETTEVRLHSLQVTFIHKQDFGASFMFSAIQRMLTLYLWKIAFNA